MDDEKRLPSLETLPMKGTYTLLILLNQTTRLKISRLGCFNLQKGYYAYTGSAMGNGATSLRKRVARHLKKKKVKHWHVDFLLSNKNARIVAVVAAESRVSKECQVNKLIKKIDGAKVYAEGVGASDCRQNCRSHLVYLGEESTEEKIADAYMNLFGHEKVATLPSVRLNHLKVENDCESR